MDAIYKSDVAGVKEWIRTSDVNKLDNEGNTPLIAALSVDTLNALEIVGILLDAGADPNIRGLENKSPLHFACERKKSGCVSMLLLKNGMVNCQDNGGMTPMGALFSIYDNQAECDWPCSDELLKCLNLLIDADANLDEVVVGWDTPLMAAVRIGEPLCVEALLQAGAKREIKGSRNKQTALQQAEGFIGPDSKKPEPLKRQIAACAELLRNFNP